MNDETRIATRQTFELSEQDVRVAIAQYIETKFGRQGTLTVTVGVATKTTGYGTNERDEHVARVTAWRDVL